MPEPTMTSEQAARHKLDCQPQAWLELRKLNELFRMEMTTYSANPIPENADEMWSTLRMMLTQCEKLRD